MPQPYTIDVYIATRPVLRLPNLHVTVALEQRFVDAKPAYWLVLRFAP